MNNSKRVLVMGASEKPERYSNMAVKLLVKHNYDIIAYGAKPGLIGKVKIITNTDEIKDIHTVSLYLGEKNQIPYYNFILNLKPKRVIFNPGTTNIEFIYLLEKAGIKVVEHCTLIMLDNGLF